MPRPLQILVLLLLLVLVLEGRAQTFSPGDYQINRRRDSPAAGFEVAELLAGSNITFTWNNTNKTVTLAGNPGTITSFAATDSTGIDFTVTNPTTTPTLSLALTKAAVGLANVENTALTTWTGSTNLTTLGTITSGTWTATPIADTYIASAATWNAKQAALVSGTNIKTINGNSLLGSGNLTITGGIGGSTGSVDNRVLRSDGTGGSTLQASAVSISDNGFVESVNNTGGFLSSNLSPSASSVIGTSVVPSGIGFLYNDSTLATVFGVLSGPDAWPDATNFDWKLPAASGELVVDSATLTTGLTFPNNGLIFKDGGNDHEFQIVMTGDATANRIIQVDFPDADATIQFTDSVVLAGVNTGDVTLAGTPNYLTLTNQVLTRSLINLGSHVTGTLPVANGGTGDTTLAANNVLLGNGTSALLEVAPGTTGNVLTSNGTTWTSTAPTLTNPAGSGSELQFRSTGTAFGAVTGSTVSGGAITLASPLTAAAGSVSAPSVTFTGAGTNTGFYTTGAGTVDVAISGVRRFWFDASNGLATSGVGITITNGNLITNSPIFLRGGFLSLGASDDVSLNRDAADTLAQRRGTNANALRVYDTFTSASDYHRLGIATVRISQTATAGATITLTGLIPDGAVVMGVTTKVTTALTGGVTGYQIGTAADPDRWGIASTATLGTTTDNRNWTAGTIECFTAATDVILTATGANFSGTGVIYVSIQYMRGESD